MRLEYIKKNVNILKTGDFMRHVRVQFRWYRCLGVELLFALAQVIYHYQGLFMLAFPTLTMGKKVIILKGKRVLSRYTVCVQRPCGAILLS